MPVAVLAALLLTAVPITGHAASPFAHAPLDREAAVMLARDGQFDAAVARLRALAEDTPGDVATLADLVTVLEWAGRPNEAVAAAEALDAREVPDYALLAWARAHRAAGDAEAAAGLLAPERHRETRTPDLGVLYALALSDLARNAEAAAHLQALRRSSPDSVEAAAAHAYVLRNLGDPSGALAAASAALRLAPDHREARRQQVLALADLGAPEQAQRSSDSRPALLDPAERQRLQLDRAAQHIRWAALAEEGSAARRAEIDRALTLLAEVEAEAKADVAAANETEAPARHDIDPPLVRRARFERIAALRVDGRMDEVIVAYAGLFATEEPTERDVSAGGPQDIPVDIAPAIPAYVHHAAADAYLATRQPHTAIALYRRVLEEEPTLLEAELGLVYALVEAERHAEAIRLIDRMAVARSPWLEDDASARRAPNWERLRIDLVAAMLRAYANQPAEAQARLEALVVDAPASAQVRRELATVYRWRGWPNRALAEIELAQAYEPEVLGGRIEQAVTLAALERFAAADSHFTALAEAFPEHPAVAREMRRWEDRQRWWLASEAGYGDSDGFADFGSRERRLRSRVSAPYVATHWQPYAFQDWASARFPEGEQAWRRAGAGLDWRRQRRHAYVEVSGSLTGETEAGITGGFDWHLGDHWSFATRLETFSLDAPLRPRAERLRGRKAEAAGRWQAHESLDARASLGRLALSDGNTRLSLLLASNHRLRADAHHITSGRAELYLSRASQEGGLYFNPRRDAALGYGVQHDWLTWRSYDWSFTQRFAATGGGYWQQDFGTAATGALRYEHLWQLGRSWRLRYGAGLASRVYDGNRERQWDALLAVEGYF
ncbi:MAG: hypothetical protein EA371_12645 [Gammaproteobacteria bacterium]|nr:MAG: hypothetical protein EA371_12645 [Gammaproteobacteria bacterium]